MFRWLTKSKKGFTIVELLIVLALLSLGAGALINLVSVANNSFNKSEERYIKQEAVKLTAELLRSGSANVAAAQTADIFYDTSIVPTGEAVDEGYSFLFTQPVNECVDCGFTVDFKETACTDCGGEVEFAGYFLYTLNKGQKRAAAQQVSDVPMFISIRPYEDFSYNGAIKAENQGGVSITIAALIDDFEYEFDSNGKLLTLPISDDIYYSLDVAYHFPNMVTGTSGVAVNYITQSQLSTANTYANNGNVSGTAYAVECNEVCSPEHCGCVREENGDFEDEEGYVDKCKDCNCQCLNKMGYVLRIYADSILSGDNTNTSIAVPKLCFIATASYGYDSGEVGLLCDFRDNVLLKTELGTAFVKAYYKLSPPVADFISEHEGLKAAVRIALKPLVAVAEYSLNDDIRAQGIAMASIVMVCIAGTTATLIVAKKRRKKESEN